MTHSGRRLPSSIPPQRARQDPRVRHMPVRAIVPGNFGNITSFRPFSPYPSGYGFSGLGETDATARGAAAIAAVRKAYTSGGLGALACNNCEKVLRASRSPGGLAGLGLNYQGAAGGASAGATVGSAVPVIGTAIGAVVGAIAGALFTKKKDPNAAEKEALKGQLDDYMRVQGSVPGRAFSQKTLEQLIDGAGLRGMWPNVKKWSGNAIGAVTADQGPNGIRAFVKTAVAAGKIDPTQLANEWTDLVNRTWGSKWFVATAGATQRQLITDLLDYFIAENKPDAPLFYAPGWTVAANAAPAPAPVPVSQPAPATGGPGAQFTLLTVLPDGTKIWRGLDGRNYTYNEVTRTLSLYAAGVVPDIRTLPAVTPLPVQSPTTTPLPNATVTPTATQPQVDVNALIQSALQQGATQQQAFLAAMQNLQSQGVTATPQVQQQVADQVKEVSAGVSSALPGWVIPLAASGAFLAIVLGKPKKTTTH